jgi:hypothetical protein
MSDAKLYIPEMLVCQKLASLTCDFAARQGKVYQNCSRCIVNRLSLISEFKR